MERTIRKCLLTSMIVFIACAGNSQTINLLQNGASNYQIVIPSKATSIEQKAAGQLKEFISQSAKVSLPVISESTAKGAYLIYIGNTNAAAKAQITRGVRDDGFAVAARGNSIYISGIKGKGTLYGADYFLEKFFGIDYLSATVVIVPNVTKIAIPQNLAVVSNPAFLTRDNFTDMGYNGKWNNTLKDYSGGYKDWHRINHVFSDWDKESEWGNFGHTSFILVPPADYFSSHPEYYSLIDGKRQKQQLNYSNPDVANIVIQNLRKMMAANPSKKYWMVGQEDEGKWCECPECLKAYAKYGGRQSGLMIAFINKVAAAFPDKQIATFAYHETEAPPQNIKPGDNVIVVSAPIGAHHNAPLDSKENSQWSNYIKQWGTLTSNQMIWDYYADFNDILVPYPNLGIMSPNFRFYKSAGIKHVFAQRPVFLKGSEMEELKAYVLSKLLWNPYLNQDSLIASFSDRYYGSAGKYIVQYLNALNTNMKKTGAVLLTQEDGLTYSKTFLAPAYLQQYYQIFDAAANAVRSDTVLLNRVNNARFSLDYFVVKMEKANGKNAISSLTQAAKDQLRQRFAASVKRMDVKSMADAGQKPIQALLE